MQHILPSALLVTGGPPRAKGSGNNKQNAGHHFSVALPSPAAETASVKVGYVVEVKQRRQRFLLDVQHQWIVVTEVPLISRRTKQQKRVK